jgi:hypothetical protein
MFSSDRLRQLITTGIRQARAFRNWYREAGCTNPEMRGITLLKEWLSPEQLAQYESHRYFDVIGRQSGTRYRIRHGTELNITQIDLRGKASVSFLASHWSPGMSCWRRRSPWKLTNGAP